MGLTSLEETPGQLALSPSGEQSREAATHRLGRALSREPDHVGALLLDFQSLEL